MYASDGYKFAQMNGQSVVNVVVPLTAGVQAVYDAYGANGLKYWRHADWLRSCRFASDKDRNVRSDLAYAPYGETYEREIVFGTLDLQPVVMTEMLLVRNWQ